MNTNIVISQDTRTAKADGSYPIIMRLGHNGRTTSISLGISVPENDWNEDKKKVKKSYVGLNSIERLNNLIEKKKADAMDIILKLHEAGTLDGLSVKELRDRIADKDKSQSFFAYVDKLVADLNRAKRTGTARYYDGIVGVLQDFWGKKELYFKDVTYSFLTRFETHHLSKGNGINGLAAYMRAIRGIYNKAIKDGYASKESYPFAAYKIRTEPTQKRALDLEFIQKIVNLDLSPKDKRFNARNWFLASYMMYGMNFVDMASVEKTDRANGRIVYRRSKTKKIYDIKISPALEKILDYYRDLDPQSEYLFPIVRLDDPVKREKHLVWARKRYNNKLKEIAEACGIESNLTSYVSRHSFATQAMLLNVPVTAISTMLGHSSLKTTEIYLKSLPSNVLDDYNSRIVGMV